MEPLPSVAPFGYILDKAQEKELHLCIDLRGMPHDIAWALFHKYRDVFARQLKIDMTHCKVRKSADKTPLLRLPRSFSLDQAERIASAFHSLYRKLVESERGKPRTLTESDGRR